MGWTQQYRQHGLGTSGEAWAHQFQIWLKNFAEGSVVPVAYQVLVHIPGIISALARTRLTHSGAQLRSSSPAASIALSVAWAGVPCMRELHTLSIKGEVLLTPFKGVAAGIGGSHCREPLT